MLITDHENGEETHGGMMVRIFDIVTWLMENEVGQGGEQSDG